MSFLPSFKESQLSCDVSPVWIDADDARPVKGEIMTLATAGASVTTQKTADAMTASLTRATDLDVALDEHAIVAITDPQGRITFVNDRFCAISKYSREELLGQDHRIISSGHHPREFFRDLWATIAHGKVWHGEIKNRAKDGSVYWVATTIVPCPGENGKPRQFVAIRADITEQKRIEAELADKLRLQGLLAGISALLVVLPSDQVDAAMAETQRLIVETLGLDRSTLWRLADDGRGMVCTHCWQRPGWTPLPPRFTTEGQLPWTFAKIMRGESICFQNIEELPPEAGRDVEVFRIYESKSNLTIPLTANGQVFGALAFSTLGVERSWREDEIMELKLMAQIIGNVLGRVRAELREDRLRSELAHAMRVTTLGEMLATFAHELNQPLAAILSNAQAGRRFLADEEIDRNEVRTLFDDIVRDDKRAAGIIQNLRAMVSKRPAVRETCCVNELVREVMELMRAVLISEKIEVRPSLAPVLPHVEVTRVELQQVLVNFVVNAVHAMKDTPAADRFIEIETLAGPSSVVVSVRDRGHGVLPELLASIFEPFVSTKATGLGMGLSICRRIIANHAGHIEARNHDGGGACFSFALPCTPARSRTLISTGGSRGMKQLTSLARSFPAKMRLPSPRS